MDDDDVVNGGSPSAFSQTDSGFAAGSGSSRSIDENDEFGVNISRVVFRVKIFFNYYFIIILQ